MRTCPAFRSTSKYRDDPAEAILEKHEELMEKADEIKVLAQDFIDTLEEWYEEEVRLKINFSYLETPAVRQYPKVDRPVSRRQICI